MKKFLSVTLAVLLFCLTTYGALTEEEVFASSVDGQQDDIQEQQGDIQDSAISLDDLVQEDEDYLSVLDEVSLEDLLYEEETDLEDSNSENELLFEGESELTVPDAIPMASNNTYSFPLIDFGIYKTSGFYPNRGGSAHLACDFNDGHEHSNVYPIYDGYVANIKNTVDRADGRWVLLRHDLSNGESFYSQYQHLSSISVNIGDHVDKGRTVIGLKGGSGKGSENGYQEHLHLIVFSVTQGTNINQWPTPEEIFNSNPNISREQDVEYTASPFLDVYIPRYGGNYMRFYNPEKIVNGEYVINGSSSIDNTTTDENNIDNLCFKDIVYPKTFRIDTTNGWNLSGGTLASNYDLKSIKSLIVDSNGNTVSSGSQSISGKYYSIRGLDTFSASDNGVKFSYIGAEGDYKWILIATDSNGRTLRLVMPFTAVSGGSTSTATAGIEYADYHVVAKESNTYLIRKLSVTAGKKPFAKAEKGKRYIFGQTVTSVAMVVNKYNNLWIKTSDNQFIYAGYHVEENDTVTKTGDQYLKLLIKGSFALPDTAASVAAITTQLEQNSDDGRDEEAITPIPEPSPAQQDDPSPQPAGQWTYQVVTPDGLNMRSEPNTSSAVVTTLWNPTTVSVSKKQSSGNYTWGYGTSSDGHTGWIVVDNNWTKLIDGSAPASHTHTPVTDAAIPATCTESGKTEGSHCSTCGETLTAQQTIPATGHQEVTIKGIAATCTQEGLTDGSKCSVCGTILKAQQTIPAAGHKPTTVEGTAATCTQEGLTDGSKCSVCGTILTAQQTIPATGHRPITVEGTAITCTQEGLTDGSKCSICGVVLDAQQPVSATGHTPVVDAAVAATCTTNGATEGSHCATCGEILVAQQVIPATGHTPVVDPAVAPAYGVEGRTEGSHCAVCGAVLVAQQPIDAWIYQELALGKVKNNGTITLAVGEQRRIVPAFATASGWTVSGYKSSKPAVASIDGNGLLTANAEGKAKITVKTQNKKKATITVKVVDPNKPTGIAITQGKTVTITMGQPLQLNTALAPESARATLTWTSSKAKVATVDGNGLVTPHGEGKAKITVRTQNKKKATITVKVVDPNKPLGIAIAQGKAVTMKVGETLQLGVGLSPATAQSALTWKTNKAKIATVDANGVVTAVKKGKAKITVTTYNKKKATIKVNVVP